MGVMVYLTQMYEKKNDIAKKIKTRRHRLVVGDGVYMVGSKFGIRSYGSDAKIRFDGINLDLGLCFCFFVVGGGFHHLLALILT